MTQSEEDRATLAQANLSRSLLYMYGFLTESENEKVHERIMKFKKKVWNRNIKRTA